MRIGNFGVLNLARSRAQVFLRPEWLGREHPVDHIPSVDVRTVIPLQPRMRGRGITKRAAGSD